MLKDCVPDVHHRFYGSHALSGERHDREAVRRWFERLGRLAPGLTLTVDDVWVKGLLHDTTIIIGRVSGRSARGARRLASAAEPSTQAMRKTIKTALITRIGPTVTCEEDGTNCRTRLFPESTM